MSSTPSLRHRAQSQVILRHGSTGGGNATSNTDQQQATIRDRTLSSSAVATRNLPMRGRVSRVRSDARRKQDAQHFLSSISFVTPLEQGRDMGDKSTSASSMSGTPMVLEKRPVHRVTRLQHAGLIQADRDRINLVLSEGQPWLSMSFIQYDGTSKSKKSSSRSKTANNEKAITVKTSDCIPRKTALSHQNLLQSSVSRYNADFLDESETGQGKHQKLLTMSGYTVSMILYVDPAELKKDLNERFSDTHPDIELTLSKLRSIKRDIFEMAIDSATIETASVALAHVYYDQLVKDLFISKPNRKLCAAACMVIALKFFEGNHNVFVSLEEWFQLVYDKWHISQSEILAYEMPVYVALNFDLHVPSEVHQMYMDRLVEVLPDDYETAIVGTIPAIA